MIPRIAHFVFGLAEQREPFHFLHYASLESCRRLLEPERIFFHHRHLPWGRWWDLVAPHLTLVAVDRVPEVDALAYAPDSVPGVYRYAHHADFIRLDALIEHGGVYADIDTIFVRPFPPELFEAPFVIGSEGTILDPVSHRRRPSLCNAVLLSEPGSEFARHWRAAMPAALDGTWSNHSGFLPERLSREHPATVRVESETSFFGFPATVEGLGDLLERRVRVPPEALSVHLWAHLWWDAPRTDFTRAHAGWARPEILRGAESTLADLVRLYLPPARARAKPDHRIDYLSLDEASGYGIAARRCVTALAQAGVEVRWHPFGRRSVPGPAYGPVLGLPDAPGTIVAHLVPEYLPALRRRYPEARLVAHTVWDTDRLPEHWVECLDQADLVIVPSQFSADSIIASPVATPVEVVPHPLPEDREPVPGAWSEIPADLLVLYTIGEWTVRKGLEQTVRAYLEAFTRSDPVVLIVKTTDRRQHASLGGHPVVGPGTTALEVARLLAGHPDPPRLRLITRELTDAEIAALHDRGDLYVSLCRSEGFGLGAFDAAARGNPVVITGFGGQLDYLAGSDLLVDFELVPVDDPPGRPSYSPDQRWAEPSLPHAVELMRRVAADPAEARAGAEAIAASINTRFSPARVAESFLRALETGPAPGRLTMPAGRTRSP